MKRFELLLNGKAYLVEVMKIDGDTALVNVNGTEYEVGISELSRMEMPEMMKAAPQTAPPPSSSSAPEPQKCLVESAGGLTTVKAPIPGLVIEAKVSVGDAVKPGDVLLVVETMKMENNVVSPRSGTVKEILVKKGDTVTDGMPLVVIAE